VDNMSLDRCRFGSSAVPRWMVSFSALRTLSCRPCRSLDFYTAAIEICLFRGSHNLVTFLSAFDPTFARPRDIADAVANS
jgi:hypothetical protein